MSKQLSSKEAGYAKNMNFFADKLKLFFALFFISFFSLEGFAQTVYTWTGSAGGTSWNDSGNWAGNVADISGSSEVKIVLENNVEISDDLTFNSSGSNQITIDTNGYNFKCNRIILVDTVNNNNNASASVIFSGSGTLSTKIFDFPSTGTHSLTVESGTTFKITSKFFGNVDNSSDKFEFKGNGTLYIPASGADLTYGQCGVFYDSTLTVLPIGTPTYFSISSDGKSIHPADSAEGLGITCSVTRNGGDANVSFSYTAEVLGGASLSDFLFKGAALTGSGEVIVQGSSNTETVHLKYNGSGLSAGDGVKLSFKTPDKSMIIAEIVWVEQSPVWTGNVSSDWGDSRNWSNGTVPGNNSEVVISSGCTNYPEITAAAFAKSVAIKSNASIVISGGSLKVESIICTGNSSMDISGGILKISSLIETKDFGCINSSGSGGTVEISGNCTFKAINPQRCEFFNIVTDSGSTFSIENDIYVLGNWTNLGIFDAQGHTVFFTGNSSDSSVTAGSSHFSGFVVKKDISVNDSVVIDGAAVFYKGVKSLSSGNFVFNGSVDCKSDVTLGCGFSFGTGSSFSAPAGNLYLKGNSDFSGCGSFSHNDGTIYFHGFTPADVRTLTTKDSQEFYNLNISGSVNLELNGAVKARKFQLSDEARGYTSTYTTELTGSGSLAAEEIVLTKCSSLSDASNSACLVLNADLTSNKKIKTENGVFIEIKSGKTLKAASLVHETSQSTPFSEIRVYGTLDVTDAASAGDGTIQLSEKSGGSGGIKLSVFSGGSVKSKKITVQGNFSNGSDSAVISNAGTIEVSDEISIKSDGSGSENVLELLDGFQLSGSGTLKIDSSILKYSGTSAASSDFSVELLGNTGKPVKIVSDSAKITFGNVSYIDEPELSVRGKSALTATSGGTVSKLTTETEDTVFYPGGNFTVSGETWLSGKVEASGASDELCFRGNIVSKSGTAAVKALTVYAGKASASPLDLVKVSGSPSGCALKIDCNFENYADFVIEDSVKFEVSGNFSGNGRFKASSSEMKFGGNIDFSSTEFDANGGTLTFAASDSNPKILTAKSDGSTQLCNLSISAGTNVESSSSFSLSGNWNNENLAGGFKASAGTVNFSDSADSVSVKGNNEFYVLKFENSGTTVKRVRFDSGKIQKINGKIISLGNESGRIKLTSDAAAPSYSDSSTWWKIDLPSGNVPAQYEFTYTDVEYSESANDIAHDWGSSVAESVEASTKNWFYRHFYWYGTIDTKWATPGNWSTNAASYAASSFYPPYLRGSSEITIAKNDVNILVLDGAEYTVKNLTVSAGASVDFNGKKISIAGNEVSDCFTNAGTVRLSGEESIVMPLDDWSKVVQADGSYIEYYGALGETLPWKTSCKNLRFADGAASSVSGTGIVSAVSVDGDTLIENGRDNELILSGANVFSGGVQIMSAGRLTLNAAGNLEIKADAECTSLTVVSPVVLNGNVSTSENQVYEKDVTGSSGFVLDAGSGHIKFGRDSVSDSVKISSLSDQVYKSPIKASAGLIFDAGSSKVKFENSGGLSPFVESAGNQIYKSTVWISSPAADSFSFTSSSSAVDIQFCKGLETQDSENTAVLLDVSPDGNVYFSGAGTVGGAASQINCTGTVYFACSSNAQELKLSSPAKALNVVHLGGNLVLAGNADTVEAEKDLVLLNGSSSVIFSDVDSGRTDLFRYLRADSDSDAPDTASSSLIALPSSWPDNSAGFPDGDTNPFCASITGLGGKTLKAGKNFYANSVDLLGSDSWNLVIPPTENASDCFAEMYNLAVSHCRATSAVAACEYCTDSGENSNIDFVRPELNVAYTVFDDVICLEFSEPVENSNNEISKAVNKAFFYFNGSAEESFAGSFTDADCAVSTDGQGDLHKFYIKAGIPWNTDATGSSAGALQSSDRSGIHRSSIPYVKMKKAAPAFFASLRDEHKNRLASRDFTAVADKAAPVLIAVSTGQELHSPYSQSEGESSQPPYDAHNFIELQYSEEILIPGVAKDCVNVQSSASLGNVSGTSGLTVAGFAKFSLGSILCGTNDGSAVDSIHALYRNFATSSSEAMNYNGSYSNPQTHRVRISVAGYSGGTVVPQDANTYRSWSGYIDSISSPDSAEVVRIANPLITDIAVQPNAVDAAGTARHPLSVLVVNQRASENDSVLYGAWDTNPPSFACFRGKTSWAAMASSNECEALGVGDEGATFISRMEFHLFDNKPSFSASDLAAWRSRVGWVSSFGEEGSVLTAARSYAADIFGGAKPFAFASDSDRATGGIRYSSLYNQASGFKYSAEDSDSFQSFASSEISPKVTINIFNDLNANRRVSTLGADGLYFSISMPPASRYSLRQTFTICYDDSAAFVTDLAGNRLRSATIKTIDITPPSFNFTLAPLGQNKLYILFSKKIAFTDSVLENISKNLELVEGNSLSAGLKIDENVPAKLCFSGNTATGFLLELNRNVTLDDVKKLCISVKNTGTGIDPITGLSANVSCIQDELGNYALVHSAHALSDFAVNAVQVNYAYDNRLIDEDGQPLPYSVSDGNWAARDFSAGQKNSGTLLSGHDISINANIYDGTQDNSGGFADSGVPVLFADNSPDAEALSTEINLNAQKNLRIWLPGLTSDVFKSFATANNSEFTEFVSGVLNGNSATFTLPVTREAQYNSWGGGNQISFIFALTDSSNEIVKIRHVPFYENENSYSEPGGVEYPLFAVRQVSSDISDIDLWSFRLKDEKLQRGGVSILNNVINANQGEKTTVQVDMAQDGNLNVVVVTLDGNIVTYLQHGRVSSGTHYYRWDGKNNSGNKVARGLYFIRVTGSGIDETRKVMVVKE